MLALDQGREGKGDPRSAACVDSGLEGDLRGCSVSFRARGWGSSSPVSPSCVHEPGALWGEHAAVGSLHPHECKPVSLLTTTERFVCSADISFLMQFIRFQVSDIRDALVSVYKVVPKVQCFLLEKVRCAMLCHPLCLYQDDPCSLLRACAHRGVPRGRVVLGVGVCVCRCTNGVCPRVCVCVCFEITGCCLTPCWAGCRSGSCCLTAGLLFRKAVRQGRGPVGMSRSVYVVSPVSCHFPSNFQMSCAFLCQLLKS